VWQSSELSLEAKHHLLSALSDTYPSLVVWRRYKQIYRVSAGMFELLTHTDLPQWPARHLRVPMPAFYVVFPPGLTMDDPARQGRRLDVEGALVHVDAADTSERAYREMRV